MTLFYVKAIIREEVLEFLEIRSYLSSSMESSLSEEEFHRLQVGLFRVLYYCKTTYLNWKCLYVSSFANFIIYLIHPWGGPLGLYFALQNKIQL